ncbi:TetR/AcrR family transcriptional regulator [Phytohabitans suffuscus]|uniref:TetR family transcriptional regulator n=1 Tax=Phytohabitans suffuscus TaxID=624315 RepID=A0A6F8YQC3_9ACTN|nr:helix-turn-helix domain-containing protein [Phytohabitans suffuscus]BCB88249.1 TetR family transcriptional regulator [Phytohabitans suffuscus]
MTVPPASRRRYDSSGRRAQARVNRERILRVATRLFLHHGYAGTSIAQVAEEAGVSTPTVFAAFKSKVNLLREAVDAAIAGDDEATLWGDRPAMRGVQDAPTAAEALRRYAEVVAAVGQRAYPIYAVANAAADADPQIADLVADLDRQRLTAAGYIATAVAAKRGDADLSRVGYLRDSLWTLDSPLLYGLLVHQRGWTVEAYRDWIATALVALALPSVRQ